jgi:predicted transcriptional regulator
MDAMISWPAQPRKPDPAKTPVRRKILASRIHKPKNSPSLPIEVPSLIRPALGPLECEVLEQVCGFGESTARQVLERMPRHLAYTTVMTTLTRLHRKGLLDCRVSGRTFLYRSRLYASQVEVQLARDLVPALIACRFTPVQAIVHVVVETIERDYPELLRELQQALKEREAMAPAAIW